MPIDLDFIEEDIDIIEIRELNDLDVTALGAMFYVYANTNNPKNETEEGYYFHTQDETCNPNKDYYIYDNGEYVLFEGTEFLIGEEYYECNGVFKTPNNNHNYPYQYIGIYVGVQEPLTVHSYKYCIRDLTSVMELINEIKQDLSNEITNRENADTTLQQNIDNEATARSNKDVELQGNIDALEQRMNNSINQEKEARIQGDNALETSKQNKLVSGENIKTINGQDVLGNGDLKVSFDPQSLSTLHMLCYEEVEDNE